MSEDTRFLLSKIIFYTGIGVVMLGALYRFYIRHRIYKEVDRRGDTDLTRRQVFAAYRPLRFRIILIEMVGLLICFVALLVG